MSRRNRDRAKACVRTGGPGAFLSPGHKHALHLIGDLISDEDVYYESQQSLAHRMGVSRRSAGRAVRSLEAAGVLRFIENRRMPNGATVRVFAFEPESARRPGDVHGQQMGEDFPSEVVVMFPTLRCLVGTFGHVNGKHLTGEREDSDTRMGSVVPQTGIEPSLQQIENRDKLAPSRDGHEQGAPTAGAA